MTDHSAPSDIVKKGHGTPLASAEELHAYIPYLLLRIANRWNVTQNRVLADYGTNNIVLRTLSILHIFRTLTVNEIAVLVVTEQSSTSRMIDTMVAAGLVERHISEADLRRRDIAITEKGEELLKESWPLMSAHYDRLIKGVSVEDLAVTTRVLGQMVENVREHAIG